MLISTHHDEALLDCPWITLRLENKIYYIKYKFLDSNEYLILLTDLTLVWFEHGNYERMKHDALQELGMEIRDEQACILFISRIKTALTNHKARDCRIEHAQGGHLKLHLPLEKNLEQSIATLFWIFHCSLLDQENQSLDYLSGPQFILQHFIIPSQTIINYFTENVLDDLPDRLRVTRAASVFTNRSLEYLSNLLMNATHGPLVSESQEITSEETKRQMELRRQEELERQKELKRKQELEEYNLKQLQKPKPPKKLKRL